MHTVYVCVYVGTFTDVSRRRDVPITTSRSNGRPELPKPVSATPEVKENREVKVVNTYEDVESPTLPSRTSRSRGRGERKVTAPPEVVTVEMTSDEQRIYALMGISPLVLSSQSISDPKNVSIAVRLPGQVSTLPPLESVAEIAIPDEATSPVVEAKEKVVISSRTHVAEHVSVKPNLPSQPEQPTDNGLEVVEASVSDGVLESSTPRRRRRRRSSAESGNNGETADSTSNAT
ncbi:MAG: hypothetical protein O3A14_02530 [Cyanobacteria bacterium]|nr:hypothetical protein [Cyanobacteriota bacterium]